MPTAIGLLAQALAKTRGPAVAGEFKTHATDGLSSPAADNRAAGILKSIHVDDSRYTRGIEMTSAGSTQFPFANQISLGNLLLLADRPSQALTAFTTACQFTKNPWDLPQAIDGIARSLRARDGSLAEAREFLYRSKSDQPTAFLGILMPYSIDGPQLRKAALNVRLPGSVQSARANLPDPPDSALQKVHFPSASSEIPFDLVANDLPTNDAILLARLGTMGDARLRDWIVQSQPRQAGEQGTQQASRDQLQNLLLASPIPTHLLLEIAEGLHSTANDNAESTAWLESCARRADPSLADWFHKCSPNPIVERTPSDSDLTRLAGIVGHARLSCELLYQIGALFQDIGGDTKSTAILFSAVVSHGHNELIALPTGSPKSSPILLAMKACEDFFWNRLEDGDDRYLKDIFTLCSDIQQWAKPNDPSTAWAINWAQIGKAECYYKWGDNDKALAAANAIDMAKLNHSQTLVAAWVKSLVFRSAHREIQAIPDEWICAHETGFKYSELALRQLFADLLTVHRLPEASAARDEYKRRYGENENTRQMSLGLEAVSMENQLVQDAQ
jgi:hypothetical protein